MLFKKKKKTETVNIQANVFDKKLVNKTISQTMEFLANSVGKSLGPYGENTIVESPIGNHKITKDGYTIINEFKFGNSIAETVYDIVKKISKNLVSEVGDGSTSSVIIANALYHNMTEFVNRYDMSPKVLMDILKNLEPYFEDMINRRAKPIYLDTEEGLERLSCIATVSNNNDKKLGKLVAEIYSIIGKDGFINLEFSKNSKDTYKIIDGYVIEKSGYIDDFFAIKDSVNKLSDKIEMNNVHILMVDDYITEKDIEDLHKIVSKVCGSLSTNLLIIAKGYDQEIYNFFKINKTNNPNLGLCAIEINLSDKFQKELYNDIAVYCNGNIISLTNNERLTMGSLGFVKKAIISSKETQLIKAEENSEEIEKYVNNLEENIEELKSKRDSENDYDREIYNINRRISKLTNKSAVLYIGGESFIEKENKKYLLEDSIYACKSALENGVIVGGNLIIPLILTNYGDIELFEKTLISMDDRNKLGEKINHNFDLFMKDLRMLLYNSFISAYKMLLGNYSNNKKFIDETVLDSISYNQIFNLNTFNFEKSNETLIVNSPSTDIEIMKASFSIVGLLVYSNQFVSYCMTKNL